MGPCSECPVCLDEMKNPRKLECGHIFHARCVSKWFTKHGAAKCPCCRQPALAWLSKSKAKLSTRLTSFVDTLDDTRKDGEFWPAWLVAHLQGTDAFDDTERLFLKDLSFQSFDRDSFFLMLRKLECSAPGTSPPSRSFVPSKISA